MLALSMLLYGGALAMAAGAAGVVKPMPRIGLRSRRRAAALALVGAASSLTAFLWPTPLLRVSRHESAIDEVMPAYQFVEHHDTLIRASPSAVFAAIRPVTAGEIRFFQTLTWVRNPRFGSTSASILAAPAEKPLLAVALSSGFSLVREVPDRELVVAIRVAPSVTGVMNFLVRPAEQGTVLSTETRVLAESRQGLRGFTAYWRAIYPGSSLIRIEWLRAIRRRAEIQSPR